MKKPFSQFSFVLVALIAVVIAASLSSCRKKAELPAVTQWDTFQDPINGLEVQYPKGWLLNTDPKRTKVYSSQIVADKFYEVYSQGSGTVNEDQGGVEIEISSEKFKDVNVGTLEAYKATMMKNYSALNLSGEQPATVEKETGVKFSYKVKVGKETSLQGEKYIVAHDSAFYTVSISGFNDYFVIYRPLFDKIIESIKLPKPKISYKDPNAAALPSAEVTKFTNDFVDFEYPYNFEVKMAKEKKGGVLHSLHLEGLRKDCTFDLEIFPTKTDKGEVKFQKFVDDNKAKFKPKSSASQTVDGVAWTVISAAPPAANIERSVYFATKGDKIYQVVVTWYKPLTNDFKPAFDKVVASLKLK